VWVPSARVQWADISTETFPPVSNSYKILSTEPTRGLFPASIGVSRVAAIQPDREGMPWYLQLIRDPRNEFLMWNSTFDDQMAISEVFPIAQRDLGGANVDARQIIAANRALGADIAMVYAVNMLSEQETEMFGTLYDAGAATPIAAFHAQAVSVMPPDDEEAESDQWVTDSKALARAKFEGLVYACVRDLIARDQPPVVEAPTGWTPAGPIMPVEWPPRQFRTGP
jgi:hypothetical protein